MEAVARFYQEGGPMMHVILLVGLVAFAIFLERATMLYLIYGKLPERIFLEVRRAYTEGGFSKAREIAEVYAKSPIGHIISVALDVAETAPRTNPKDEEVKEIVRNAVEEEYLRVVPRIQRGIPVVQILANIATLLGLLGTIFGLIQAFRAVALAEPAQKQILLARGISIAMNTTAFGLTIAIPSLVFYTIISTKANSIVSKLDEYSIRVINWVSLLARGR